MQTAQTMPNREHWTLDSIQWDAFDRAKLDPEIIKIIKAAALVEYNAHDYARYLGNVFADDTEFQKIIAQWSEEEVQHGMALGRWAELADPSFNFAKSFKRFTDGYKINLDAKESVRGSRSAELVARCIVETGTSSYYTALAEATNEPVLKDICRKIAGDEHRHYKMFYDALTRYLAMEKLNKLERLQVGLSRVAESEDDELAYAYYAANSFDLTRHAANDNAAASYDRLKYSTAYAARAFGFYRSHHIRKVVNMVFMACGLKTQGLLAKIAGKIAWFGIRSKYLAAKKRDQAA